MIWDNRLQSQLFWTIKLNFGRGNWPPVLKLVTFVQFPEMKVPSLEGVKCGGDV